MGMVGEQCFVETSYDCGMDSNIPMVSVIVPVYNARKTIKRCIESIINQGMRSYEIILVDDGSTDDFQSEIIKYDEVVTVINQTNKGAAAARNTGIAHCKGKYICFVDADDYLESGFLSEMLKNICKYRSDICISGIKRKELDDVFLVSSYEERLVQDKAEIIKSFLIGKIGVSVWGALYDSNLIKNNNILFVEGCKTEDSAFKFNCLMASERISFTANAYYVVVNTAGSICNTFSEKMLDLLDVIDFVEEKLMCKNILYEIDDEWRIYLQHNYLWLYNYGARFIKDGGKKIIVETHNHIKQKGIFINKHGNVREKIIGLLIEYKPLWYAWLKYNRNCER